MCGRLYQTLPLARLLKIAKANSSPNSQEYNSSYNVCPTTFIPAIKPSKLYLSEHAKDGTEDNEFEKEENREVEFMKWGHKSPHNFIVNGRI
jgi:putative SOS response-associated peptidase YedK